MALPDHSTYRQATQNNLKWTQAYYCPELIIDRVHVVHIHTVALYKHLSTSELFLKCLQGLRHHWSHSCENKEKYKSSGKMMSGLLCTWHVYSFNLQPDDQWKICRKETTEAINLGGLESHKLPAHLFFCARPVFRFPLNWCCWACWAHNSASIDCPESWHWTEEINWTI